MSHTEEYKKLPGVCKDPSKRKRLGRGRWKRGAKRSRRILDLSSSSASESPMKRVTFDLTGFSDESDETLEIRAPTYDDEPEVEEDEEDEEDEGDEGDEGDATSDEW